MPNISPTPVNQYLDESGANLWSLDNQGNVVVAGNAIVNGTISSNAGNSISALISKTTLTSAQLLALKTTPVQLLAAPGAGLAYYVEQMSFKYTFVTTAYTLNAGTLKVFYGIVANAHALCADQSTSFLTAAASRAIIGVPGLAVATDTLANNINAAIFAGNDGSANYTLGDATLSITLVYSIITP